MIPKMKISENIRRLQTRFQEICFRQRDWEDHGTTSLHDEKSTRDGVEMTDLMLSGAQEAD